MENRDATGAARPYQYTPLSDPISQIRLLEVACRPKSPVGPIRCNLTTWNVETAPPYAPPHRAISYTWGPEEPTETGLLDQGWISVLKNCADVLRQLLHLESSQYYRLDALCIYQNNTSEKNAQVAMMDSTFRNAAHVFICLGNYIDDGETRFRRY